MWPSLDIDSHIIIYYDDDTQEYLNVVQYVVKVWPQSHNAFRVYKD